MERKGETHERIGGLNRNLEIIFNEQRTFPLTIVILVPCKNGRFCWRGLFCVCADRVLM
jgi:hypothetical protein